MASRGPAWGAVVLMAMGFVASARAQELRGRVVGGEGQPLAGVTVFLDGTTQGDVTDHDGRFSIAARQAGGYLLVARHVAFKAVEREVLLRQGRVLALPALVMPEAVGALGEVVVEALSPRTWRRYVKTFEEDVLGRTSVARRARLVNPEVLTFEQVKGGVRATASAPLVVENPATGYRIRVFVDRYEHHFRNGGYRLARRLLFEEMGRPSRKQVRLRERLYRGSRGHFLRAWYHGQTRQEGFRVYGPLAPPHLVGELGHAPLRGFILVEHTARPDRAYRYLLSRRGVRPPFSKTHQVSRIAFLSGFVRVAANGHAVGPVRLEGYWAFCGVGDAVPPPPRATEVTAAR